MLLINLLLYILSFVFIWIGAGLIVSSASKFSKKLKLSPFAFSFIFLGVLTSIPEFSVGLRSVADKTPQIFVGNLLGGIIVLFLFVIPILAIFGKGISLKHEMDSWTLITTLIVILSPSAFILDGKVTKFEGIVLIIFYMIILFLVQRKNGIFDHDNSRLLNIKAYSYKDIFKLLAGICIVFFASNLIVEKTIYFATILNTPAFYISLLIIALGTDLPELSLAIRTVISGQKEIAMGDYIGAAAVSPFLFGIFTLLNKDEIIINSNFIITFVFTFIAMGLFYFFFRTKNYISRNQGIFMVIVYISFILLEIKS
jgi:cation:H+ antiporter